MGSLELTLIIQGRLSFTGLMNMYWRSAGLCYIHVAVHFCLSVPVLALGQMFDSISWVYKNQMYLCYIEPYFFGHATLTKRYFRPYLNKEIKTLDQRKSQGSISNKSWWNFSLRLRDCILFSPSLLISNLPTHTIAGVRNYCCDRMLGSSGIVISGYRHSLLTVAPTNFICVWVCVCVCLSVRLLAKCRSNRYTDFDAVFAK